MLRYFLKFICFFLFSLFFDEVLASRKNKILMLLQISSFLNKQNEMQYIGLLFISLVNNEKKKKI